MLWLVRTAICMLYPRAAGLPGAADCGIDAFLHRLRADTTPTMWLGVVLGALVFHASPLLTVFVPLPALLLPASLRDKHAYRVTTTSFYLVRQSITVLKLAAGLCWGADPEVRARLALAALPPDPDGWRTT